LLAVQQAREGDEDDRWEATGRRGEFLYEGIRKWSRRSGRDDEDKQGLGH